MHIIKKKKKVEHQTKLMIFG